MAASSNHPPTTPVTAPGATSPFAATPAQLDLPALEEQILAFWRDNDVEGRALRRGAAAHRGEGEGAYVFFDGPPFATGLPHYGHILPGTIKDIVPRYHTMNGKAVERRFGWDCHGLPIESLVESQLGTVGAAAIEAYGIDKFNAACRAGVLRYTEQWRATVRRMGRWVDFDNDYKTMDLAFMETVWWVFHALWDRGFVYEGHRVQPVSPALGTPLSNFEVAQGPQERDPVTRKDGHRRRQDPSITVRFRLDDGSASLWAWTTTPWTLPSNLALAVHPEFVYRKVRFADGEVAILESSRLEAYAAAGKVGAYEVLEDVSGSALVGLGYEPLFPFFAAHKQARDGHAAAFRVVAAEYVTRDSGTGIVHQAPAFGEDDYEVGRREGLPVINPLSLNGVFDGRVGEFAGLFAKDADRPIVERLKREGRLVDQDTLVHPYPHCYRTDQPLLYMALSTWFVRVEQLRDQLVEANEQIRWVPEHVGTGRFGNWLAAARDWNVARNRYWGTPIPIWRCDRDPSDMVCVGSVAQLEELAGLAPGSVSDLHRESVDGIVFPSQRTPGGTMRRVPEVFDCWFESGSMPYAQNHYPFDAEKRRYVEDNLPADFIAEGLDQTRGWFYTLHVLSTALFGRPAFRNVIVNGLVLAEDGKKMSKRLKNYPDPNDVIREYGADALRAYLIDSAAVKAEPMRFSERGVRDTVRTVILPLWSACHFFVTYARADGWVPTPADLERPPEAVLDRWICSRLQAFVEELRTQFDAYTLFNVVGAFQRLCDDVNNWYIRRGRRRFWRARDDAAALTDKHAAYATLLRVLTTAIHAMAPVLPFLTEWLYQRLLREPGLASEPTVHERRFPVADPALRDPDLEERVALARTVVTLGMAARETARVGVRRPLRRVVVAAPDPAVRAALAELEEDVIGELNVKALELRADDSDVVELAAKANFKTLGKRLGGRMKEVAAAVTQLDGAALRGVLAAGTVDVAGETLTLEDLVITRTPRAGRVAEAGPGLTVILDTEIDDALRHEGLGRELVNRIQTLRKQAGLAVSDRVEVQIAAGPALAAALADPAVRQFVAADTLASALVEAEAAALEAAPHTLRDDIDGEALLLGLRAAARA